MSSPLLVGTVRPLRARATPTPTPALTPAPAASPSWFRETAPSAFVAEAVVARWVGVGGWDRTLRVLPDGCADLVWSADGLIVVGARAEPQRFPVAADHRNVGLRLCPGAGRAVLGVALDDLPPGAVPAVDLWGREAARLEDRLHDARDDDHRHELLERHVAARLDGGGRGVDPAVLAAVRMLRRRSAHDRVHRVSVARTAADVGLSPRELRRRFATDVGYGPKTLQRVLRFRDVVHDLRPGASLADLAARHGYADQSHLGRECRALSGSSPARLLALLARATSHPGSP